MSGAQIKQHREEAGEPYQGAAREVEAYRVSLVVAASAAASEVSGLLAYQGASY